MKVIRIDCKKRWGYCRIWVDAENIEQAINKTGIKNVVDYYTRRCKSVYNMLHIGVSDCCTCGSCEDE